MRFFSVLLNKIRGRSKAKYKSNNLQQAIINLFPNYYIFWKDKNLVFMGCNQAFATLAGQNSPEDLIGKNDYDFWPKDEADQYRNDDRIVMESKQSKLNIEEPQTTPDGKKIILSTSKVPLFNENGDVCGVLGIFSNITEQKLSEKTVIEKNLELERAYQLARRLQDSIIDHIPNYFIFWKDKNSHYLGCNAAYAQTAGIGDPSNIIGKNDYDLPWSKQESAAYIADDQEVMKSQRPKLNIVEPQTLATGEKIVLLTSKVPLFNDKGEVYGILGIYSDITEQKVNEQKIVEANQKLEKAYKAKTEFIRNVSHDIRTPLSGILQSSRLMYESDIKEEEIPEYAYDIWQAAARLMNLFNQVIEITKAEAYEFEDQVVKFDLNKLLDELRKTYQVVAKNKNINLQLTCSKNVPRYLLGMNLRLHRVLMNLLGNAFKFTESGSVKLLVDVEKREKSSKNQVFLKFSVTDSGIGIPKDKHAIIFEPFERLKPAYQGQFPGSGLGLSLVKEYVTKMGGEVCLESELGHGATFRCLFPFTLPALSNDEDVINTEYEVEELLLKQSPPQLKTTLTHETVSKDNVKMHVLLVEDDTLAQKMGSKILSNIPGYHVDVATSGEKALELSLENVYNLIYMDIGLPGISGIETAKQIRDNAQNPNQSSFIVALTAHADEEVAKQCIDVGMMKVLEKPLTPEKALQMHTYQNRGYIEKMTELPKLPIIDWELWLKRVNGQEELAHMAFHTLGQQIAENRSALTLAFNNEDLVQLAAVTHKLKGALGYCGLPGLEYAIKAFELAAKNKDSANLEYLYKETMKSLDEVEKAFNEWVKTHL